MSEEQRPGQGQRSVFDVVDLITGRIGKITALVVAVGGLGVGALAQWETIAAKLAETGLYSRPPCVVVEPLNLPATVKYSQWDALRLRFKGRNNCAISPGLYVTFVRRRASDPRFVLGPPHGDLPDCKGTPEREPKCWDPKKPVWRGKGNWEWEVLAPPLERLSDPRRHERISITWAVYDVDAPTKPAIRIDNAEIDVEDDTAGAPRP